ncbi:uncharacterized protein LOC141907916 [Tubulanus polymorphus]|uniref:uncharacterized protein LOC141898640 n=1 Tax=Tubulanus polymorphus TaxID=672921 RepID=UPI003DA5C51A
MEELKKVKMLNVEQLIVHVGTNNMTRDVPLEIVLRRHVELIRLLLYKCTGTIIVPALFPRCDDFDADTKIFHYNEMLHRECFTLGVKFVDFHFSRDLLSPTDLLHPSRKGNQFINNRIMELLLLKNEDEMCPQYFPYEIEKMQRSRAVHRRKLIAKNKLKDDQARAWDDSTIVQF